MLSKLPQTSPLRKKQTTFNSFTSFHIREQSHSEQKYDQIPSLMTKFVNLSSQIQIHHNISSFNLIQYENDNNIKFDQNIAAAKLKRIQNNAELKRANMVRGVTIKELLMRKRKIMKIKESKNKEQRIQQSTKQSKNQYKNIFKSFSDNKKKQVENDSDSVQQDLTKNADQKPETSPDGILYFRQLRRHPKILTYTLQKMKQKKLKTQRQNFEKRDRILKFRNEMRTISHSQPRIPNKQKIEMQQICIQPQVIFQNIFNRIYTKRNNRSVNEARNDQRLNQFMHRQEQILEGINEKSLSKQHFKQLKGRFNDLLNQLYQVDKKHRIQQNYQKKLNSTTIDLHSKYL